MAGSFYRLMAGSFDRLMAGSFDRLMAGSFDRLMASSFDRLMASWSAESRRQQISIDRQARDLTRRSKLLQRSDPRG